MLNVVEALLDPVCASVALRRDAHQVSSRSVITGYLGILAYIITVAPILAIIYFLLRPGTLVYHCLHDTFHTDLLISCSGWRALCRMS